MPPKSVASSFSSSSRATALPAHVVIAQDGSNVVECELALLRLLDMLGVPFLRYNEFNEVTMKRGDDDEVTLLKKKIAKMNVEKKSKDPNFEPDLVVGDIGFVTTDPLAVNALDDVYYLNPVTDECEDTKRRTSRIVAWTWLVTCLVNHKHLLESVTQYAISRLLSLLKLSFCTGGAQVALKSVRDMCSMELGSQGWSGLCPKIATIAAAQARVTDVNYKLPPALLPAFILSALDEDGRYAIVVSDLRKEEANGKLLTVEGVVAAVSKTAVHAGTDGIRASAAAVRPNRKHGNHDGRVPDGLELGQCFNWFEDGKCRFGERCRFSHDADAPRAREDPRKRPRQRGQGCLECGDKSHGFSACPVRAQRAIDDKAQDAAIAANVATIASMKAEFKSFQDSLTPPAVAGKFASLDPYYAGNEMSTLFRAPGGPGSDDT